MLIGSKVKPRLYYALKLELNSYENKTDGIIKNISEITWEIPYSTILYWSKLYIID